MYKLLLILLLSVLGSESMAQISITADTTTRTPKRTRLARDNNGRVWVIPPTGRKTALATVTDVLNTTLTSPVSLTTLPGYAPGKLLIVAPNGAPTWTTIIGSGTVTMGGSGSTTAPPSGTALMAGADSTINVVNYALMSDVPLGSVAAINTFLLGNQTNKRGVIAPGTYPLGAVTLEQRGTWTNVAVVAPSSATITSTNSTVMIFQGNHVNNKVHFEGIWFVALPTSGGGNGAVFSNELHEFHGLTFYNCGFVTGEATNNNAFGFALASTANGQGAISSDFYFRKNFMRAGRMGFEALNQVYDDVIRLRNVIWTGNTVSNTQANPNEQYRMGSSFSGLIQNVYHARNRSINAKDIAFEFVNIQDAVVEDNVASAVLEDAVGYSITDDFHDLTKRIQVRRGTFNMTSRPFQIYGSQDVHIDGGNYVCGRGADVSANNCSFTNLNIQVINTHGVEALWQFTASCYNNSLTNSTLSSFGSAAAGREPSFETVVLRNDGQTPRVNQAYNHTLTNLTLNQGKRPGGGYWTPGNVVNQGAASNISTNITVNQEQ